MSVVFSISIRAGNSGVVTIRGNRKYCIDRNPDPNYHPNEPGLLGITCDHPLYHSGWTKFTVEAAPGGEDKIFIKGARAGKYCADTHEGVICNRPRPSFWELFTLEGLPDGKTALKGGRMGKYCSDIKGIKVICNSDNAQGRNQILIESAGKTHISPRPFSCVRR